MLDEYATKLMATAAHMTAVEEKINFENLFIIF